MQTGEFDYAWNLQVEDEILKRLEQGGKGRADIVPGGNIEHIQLNNTDPWTEVDGERSSIKTKHPFLTDPAVRQALNLLVDRGAVQEHIYGRTGIATANFLNKPPALRAPRTPSGSSTSTRPTRSSTRPAGRRAPTASARRTARSSSSSTRPRSTRRARRTRQIVKQAAQKAGIDMELKSVTASVFFSSDVANPDTYTQFYTDIQMYTTTMTQPDPELFMNQFTSWEVASKENKWQGRNITRWKSEEYDKLYRAAESELDPVKRAALFIKMNELVIQNVVVIPVVFRPRVARHRQHACASSRAAGTPTSGTCRTGTARPRKAPGSRARGPGPHLGRAERCPSTSSDAS